MSKNNNLPVVGNTYTYYDDGKIKPSRRMKVMITEIIPFKTIDPETLTLWKEESERCDWLYAKETDYFILADLKTNEKDIEKVIFVRHRNNNWFSLGWWGGLLDIDGSLDMGLIESLIGTTIEKKQIDEFFLNYDE